MHNWAFNQGSVMLLPEFDKRKARYICLPAGSALIEREWDG